MLPFLATTLLASAYSTQAIDGLLVDPASEPRPVHRIRTVNVDLSTLFAYAAIISGLEAKPRRTGTNVLEVIIGCENIIEAFLMLVLLR